MIAGETLVVPIRRSVGDLGNIYTFNEVGDKVWTDLAAGARSAAELASLVSEVFDIDAERALQDVQCFLNELQTEGLVSVTGDSSKAGAALNL